MAHGRQTLACAAAVVSVFTYLANVSGADDGLEPVLGLKDKLFKAVCDENVVSRAPTLEATRRGPDEDAFGGIVRDASINIYDVDVSISERMLISYLLGDRATMLAASKFAAELKKPGQRLEEIRRQLSLEICTSVVTPGGLNRLVEGGHAALIPARKSSIMDRVKPSTENEVLIRLRDVDGRFGDIGGKWWVPGWVEPHEVVLARGGGKTPRVYRRLANPVTNRMQLIAVLGPRFVPIGFVHPRAQAESTKNDWTLLGVQAKSESNRNLQFETYRLMMEADAYDKFAKNPRAIESVRGVQEFYRNLMNAYRTLPGGQYLRFGKNANVPNEKELKQYVNREFMDMLSSVTINGARAGFGLFPQDKVLHGMYEEYRSKLEKL